MLPVLLGLGGVFVALLLLRLGGSERRLLMSRWPTLLFAGAALLAVWRGAWWLGLGLFAVAAISWVAAPFFAVKSRPAAQPADPRERESLAILGLSASATSDDVRRAYRQKMAQAHPDRGGSHDQAAKLTAARDYLLKQKRR